ncbi:MAG TPA: hypothetical protein VGE40_07500, partial [Bacilli bacterium]
MSNYRYYMIVLVLTGLTIINTGCSESSGNPGNAVATNTAKPVATPAATTVNTESTLSPAPVPLETVKPEETPVPDKAVPAEETGENLSIPVVANAAEVTVLVNKNYRLPNNYVPADLVVPDVPFTFEEKLDKRKMRKEAASFL